MRFSTPGLEGHHPDVDAKAGDYVSVPIRAPHTFSNPFDEEAVSNALIRQFPSHKDFQVQE